MFLQGTGSSIRFGLVMLAGAVMTLAYYLFSHFVHHLHFDPKNEHERHHENHRGGPFEDMYLKKQDIFLYGFALPLVLLALVSLVWNPTVSGSPGSAASIRNTKHSRGEVNPKFWTFVCFIFPLLLIVYDGASGHFSPSHSAGKEHMNMHWNWYISICMSLMSPSGYAAAFSLSLFLIPVSKHSPILDWLNVTPVQALAFHRISGWCGFWFSVLHGYLHLRHLMDVLNGSHPHPRPWYQELWILLVPSSWDCIGHQNPLAFLYGQDHFDFQSQQDSQCWLALVNATGMISVLAYVVLAITSLPCIRRASYTLFYCVHIPTAWIMLITAIWHYPTCALLLIPNIIYYLSFNIPIIVTQTMDRWSNKTKSMNPMVEARLIQGGSLELVFAKSPNESRRHENRFARLSHPDVSVVSHPFSIFSCQDLLSRDESSSSLETHSVLLRPTGPFTEGLTKVLFPDHSQQESDANDDEDRMERLIPRQNQDSSGMPLAPSKLQFDSYYAGSFAWIDRAMLSHDEILMVAGGVGIVPILEFLPSLQRRIEEDTNTTTEISFGDVNEALLEEFNCTVGPRRIHLHWYCRDVGLASHVWCTYLRHHLLNTWESQPVCKDRLKIHLHLTSLDSTSSHRDEEGNLTEQVLLNLPNIGLVKKQIYSKGKPIYPVKDARTATSWWFGLLLPGGIMVAGTALHWWWYKTIIVNDEYRFDNLIMRSHSIIFTLLVAVLASLLVEHFVRCFRQDDTLHNDGSVEESTTTEITMDHKDQAFDCSNPSLLKVHRGRPAITTVIRDILKATRPGVYMCGPQSLMESVELSIKKERKGCAFYREDSNL